MLQKKNLEQLWILFKSMFLLSACTFGGGFVIVSLMKKKFVEELKWLEEDEMLDITAITQSSPGPLPVNASVIIGYRMQGVDVLDAEKMTVNQRIRKGLENVDVPSLLALQDGSVWAATYGRGFVRLKKGTLAYKLDREQLDNEVPFPRPAQMEEPSVVLRRLERLGSDAHAGKNIVFRGED